jgi:hypothetical protein
MSLTLPDKNKQHVFALVVQMYQFTYILKLKAPISNIQGATEITDVEVTCSCRR